MYKWCVSFFINQAQRDFFFDVFFCSHTEIFCECVYINIPRTSRHLTKPTPYNKIAKDHFVEISRQFPEPLPTVDQRSWDQSAFLPQKSLAKEGPQPAPEGFAFATTLRGKDFAFSYDTLTDAYSAGDSRFAGCTHIIHSKGT